jgi:hypothetical protein
MFFCLQVLLSDNKFGHFADLEDEDINETYVPKNSTKKLAAVAKLPRGAAAICILTFGITLVGGLVLGTLFSKTQGSSMVAVARNRATSANDWRKTSSVDAAARHIDKQVNAVQNMEAELSLFDDLNPGRNGGRGDGLRSRGRASLPAGYKTPRSREDGGGGRESDMQFLDPVQPMKQYDEYKKDYRQQERRRQASKRKGNSGLTAAMQVKVRIESTGRLYRVGMRLFSSIASKHFCVQDHSTERELLQKRAY